MYKIVLRGTSFLLLSCLLCDVGRPAVFKRDLNSEQESVFFEQAFSPRGIPPIYKVQQSSKLLFLVWTMAIIMGAVRADAQPLLGDPNISAATKQSVAVAENLKGPLTNEQKNEVFTALVLATNEKNETQTDAMKMESEMTHTGQRDELSREIAERAHDLYLKAGDLDSIISNLLNKLIKQGISEKDINAAVKKALDEMKNEMKNKNKKHGGLLLPKISPFGVTDPAFEWAVSRPPSLPITFVRLNTAA